jgi:hypothetical protein
MALAGCDDPFTSTARSNPAVAATPTPVAAAPATPAAAPAAVIGSATLSWTPPTENTDGTALTDLAGYRIYYGTDMNNLSQLVTIASVGVTRYVIDNLTQGTWYFTIRAYNSVGAESSESNSASKTIA